MNRKTWTGELVGAHIGARNWRIASTREPYVEFTLLGVDLDERSVANGLQRVSIDWQDEGTAVELTAGSAVIRVHAETVLVHEPLTTLYDALPLARFDARAHRFWQRVFWLVRVPGGRSLLRMVARRARA